MCNQLLYAIKHALRGIQRRKLKNLISTIGILIGVSLLAGVQIATDSLVNGMKETVNLRYGNGDIIISKGAFQPEFFNYSIFEQLKNDSDLKPYIDGISPRITSQVFISSLTTKQTESFVTIIGINETLDNPFGALIPDDSYENNDFNFTSLTDVQCIVGKELGEAVVEFDIEGEGRNEVVSFPSTTQSMIMGYIDALGNASSTALVVKGIAKVEGKGVLETGYTIFTKLNYLQNIYHTNGSNNINTIVISTTQSNDNARFVADMLEDKLNFYLGKDEGVQFVVDPQKLEAYGNVEDSIKSFRIVLYVFGSLIIISGVLLILNITLMNIDERQRSIGIMRAIGMTQRQLLTVQITESMVLGGFGSLFGLGAGVLNGMGIIFLLENFLDIGSILTNIPLIVKPVGLVISFVIGIVISLIAALYPAWKASRINIVETINEIETPQLDRRSGNWSIFTGFIIILAAGAAFTISLLITPEWRWMMFIGSIFGFIFGMGFTLSRFVGPKIGFNSFALAWMAAGILSVVLLNPYLTDIGLAQDQNLYVFLIGMLGLVFGTIVFIAINLEWISNRFNDVFQKMKRMRSLGIISMRYVGKKKTRSALTFAIFGVILTMNVFLSVFTGSFTLGFDDFAEKEEGGVNIVAYSLSSVEPPGNPFETIREADPDNIVAVSGVKFRYSLTGAVMNLEFTTTNETTTETVTLPIPTDMWGVNDNFTDLTDYAFSAIWDGIDIDPWEAVKNGSKRYVILPFLIQEFEFDEDNTLYSVNQKLGDTLVIPEWDPLTNTTILGNYTIIAFVQTTSYSMSFSAFMFTGEDSPIFNQVPYNNAYLIQTNPKLTTEENVEVSRKIEAKLTGFDTLTLRDRLEQVMEFVTQSINFMQAFVSLGLVVGVFGLIVVSLRGITERTREIGMMRALGFQRSEVIAAVVIEIFAVAFVGLVIGFANGLILGYGMHSQYLSEFDFAFLIPWAMLAIFIAVTVALSIFAAVIPARRASKIPPSDALRYTG